MKRYILFALVLSCVGCKMLDGGNTVIVNNSIDSRMAKVLGE